MDNRKEILHPNAEAYIKKLEAALSFCTHLLDGYLKPEIPVPLGLCPTFYLTFSDIGDIELLEKYKQIKGFLNETK